MIQFSTDPQLAEKQMRAILFYLTTFGYIDGDFEEAEKGFVREYIGRLVAKRVQDGMPTADTTLRAELTTKFTAHFTEVFEGIDAHVRDLFTEAVAKDEDQDAFIHAKLKLRCFEIFQDFDRENQQALIDAMDELIAADGHVHPAEAKFRDELLDLLGSHEVVELEELEGEERLTITGPIDMGTVQESHPFFAQFEHHYSADGAKIQKQIEADRQLIDRVIETLTEQRIGGTGNLGGHKRFEDFEGQAPFLDGHIYVHPIVEGERYELTVLGDLHGCYSCLKGAVMQSRFLDKVARYKQDPKGHPKPMLVLLGDYIDRGLFSLNGVLRTAMQLFVTAPEHVVMLRGNHEYYLEYKGQIFGGVKPAEAINTLKPHLPVEVFQHYMELFEVMPTMLVFGKTLFVHGGIPRDRTFKERWKDLSSLNDPDIRFQMLWSDPSSVDVIPAALQEQSARFPFGRLQAAAFLQRIGCTAMIRGHEKVDAGFCQNYHDDAVTVMTLFSAGGADNQDLPEGSSYRSVTPKALTCTWDGGDMVAAPWSIDYQTFNDPKYNAFFQKAPEIEHRG